MDFEKIGKIAKKIVIKLLFPHIAFAIIILPLSVAFLVWAMLSFDSDSPVAIASYVLSAYTLAVWCIKMPRVVGSLRAFSRENRYVNIWRDDIRLRTSLTLAASLLWNTAYSVFQFALGYIHHTFWYCSLGGYYLSLAVMRFFLLRYTGRHTPGDDMRDELKRYRACGVVFLVTNLAISLMIFFMVYWNRTFHHHEITAIAMAAYTFTSLSRAIVNIVKYRKFGSPVYSASKAISLASACVSMLTLESAMLTAFGGDMTLAARRIFLGISGAAVSLFIIAMANYMIVNGTKRIKKIKKSEELCDGKQ